MSVKGSKTTCSGLDWNVMLGLLSQLKKEQKYRDYLLISIGCHLGIRASDLLSLKWEDILGKDQLILKEKKTGKERLFSIHPRCIEGIEFVWKNQPRSKHISISSNVFINKKGRRISVQYINRRLKILFSLYKIKTDNASTHTLRKTFGRRVYEMNDKSENSLILLSMVFSHSSLSITKRYLGITREEIQDVYLNL